jgi:iron complex outermembrane receptor protein
MTGGARLDGHQGHAPVVSPRMDLVWRAGPRTSWKLLAGSAFRAPSPYEIDYFGNGQLQTSGLRPERVMTVEGALEQELGPVTGSLSAYTSRVRDLIDLATVDSAGNVQFRNRARVSARGLEGELRWVGASGDRVRLATAWQRSVEVDGGAELTNSPRWNAHLVATHAPIGHAHSVGFGVRYLSPRLTLLGQRTTAAFVTDGRVGRRFGRGLELGLEARNLFDARYGDPGSGEHPEDVLLQDGRMLFVTLSVRPLQAP